MGDNQAAEKGFGLKRGAVEFEERRIDADAVAWRSDLNALLNAKRDSADKTTTNLPTTRLWANVQRFAVR